MVYKRARLHLTKFLFASRSDVFPQPCQSKKAVPCNGNLWFPGWRPCVPTLGNRRFLTIVTFGFKVGTHVLNSVRDAVPFVVVVVVVVVVAAVAVAVAVVVVWSLVFVPYLSIYIYIHVCVCAYASKWSYDAVGMGKVLVKKPAAKGRRPVGKRAAPKKPPKKTRSGEPKCPKYMKRHLTSCGRGRYGRRGRRRRGGSGRGTCRFPAPVPPRPPPRRGGPAPKPQPQDPPLSQELLPDVATIGCHCKDLPVPQGWDSWLPT